MLRSHKYSHCQKKKAKSRYVTIVKTLIIENTDLVIYTDLHIKYRTNCLACSLNNKKDFRIMQYTIRRQEECSSTTWKK